MTMPDLAELWSPILLTLKLAGVTTIVLLIVGTPVAWWLARSQTAWKEVVAAVRALGVKRSRAADGVIEDDLDLITAALKRASRPGA